MKKSRSGRSRRKSAKYRAKKKSHTKRKKALSVHGRKIKK